MEFIYKKKSFNHAAGGRLAEYGGMLKIKLRLTNLNFRKNRNKKKCLNKWLVSNGTNDARNKCVARFRLSPQQ
jgi:hypothetical protein